jgi:hypothetical protein
MRTILALALLLAAIGCSNAPTRLGSDPTSLVVPSFEDLRLGEPIEQDGLVLVPVSTTKQDQDYADYASLAEAKKNGWIEIVEVPGEETVETLKVRYTGTRAMILFAGELLLGGKQDRVVAKDTIIKPDTTVDVMVFCVEPGRWEGQTMHFDAQQMQVPMAVNEEAIAGDQYGVWDKVAASNQELAPDADGTSLRYSSRALTSDKKFTTGVEEALAALRRQKDVVGVVIVLDGQIASFEYFQSPRLFEANAESVLRGALATSFAEKSKGGRPQMSDVADFVARCLKSAEAAKLAEGEQFARIADDGLEVTGGVSKSASTTGGSPAVVHGSFFEKKDK